MSEPKTFSGEFRTLPENPAAEPFDGDADVFTKPTAPARRGRPPTKAAPEAPKKTAAKVVATTPAPAPLPQPLPEEKPPTPPQVQEEKPPTPPQVREEEVSASPGRALTSPPTNNPGAGGRSVCILLPQYKTTNPLTFTSVLGLRNPDRNAAILNFGDAFIVHTRNQLAHAFVTQTRAEWALFADDDMVLPFGNAAWFEHATGFAHIPKPLRGLHTLDRLMASGKTLVGGLYFGRQPGHRRAVFAEGHNPGPYAARNFASLPQDRVVRTRWVGTGCLLVNRSVFIDIQSRFPHLAPSKPGDPWQYFSAAPDRLVGTVASYLDDKATKEELARALADAQRVNLGKGEDVLFCERAEAAGHPAHVDLGLLCGHVGHAVY